MPKKVTIDDLARMVKGGFDHSDKRFDETAKKADVDKRFEEVDKQLSHIDLRLGHVDARLAMIERDVSDIRKHFVYRDEFEDVLARISNLEKKAGVKSGK